MSTRGRSQYTPPLTIIMTPEHDDDRDNNHQDNYPGDRGDDSLLTPMLVDANNNKNSNEAAATDPFYSLDLNHDQTIVRVFPINYDRLVQRLKHSKWFAAAASVLLSGVGIWMRFHSEPPLSSLDEVDDDRMLPWAMSALFATVFVGMWWTEATQEQLIRGQHVAVTRMGIRRDVLDENGVQTTTTIPWKHVRRIDRCSRDLVRIHMVHRTSKPVELEGLYDEHDFVELVNTLKDRAETAESSVKRLSP